MQVTAIKWYNLEVNGTRLEVKMTKIFMIKTLLKVENMQKI